MTRLLGGFLLAVIVTLTVPTVAAAAPNDPYFTVSGMSYSNQPGSYTVRVINNLESSTLVAHITNAGIGTRSMKCVPAGALGGLGPWRCTFSGRFSPGSLRVSAQGVDKSHPSRNSHVVSHSATVSSRFHISSATSPREGDPFSVSGSYDHISGASDFRVRATVTSGGTVVGGQSGTSCNASGGSFRCSLRSVIGAGSTYSIKVTEVSSNYSRSDSTSISVATTAAPSAPSFTSPSSFKVAKQPLTITGFSSGPGLRIELLVDPGGNFNWSSPTSTCLTSSSGGWSCKLPKSYSAGKHTIAARAVDTNPPGKISSVSTQTTTLKAKPKPKPTVTPSPTPTAETAPEPEVKTPVTSPVSHVFNGLSGQLSDLIGLLILALAITALARPGPLSLILAGTSASFADRVGDPANEAWALRRGVGPGDNSPSWRAFGYEATDFWSRTAPLAVFRHSPFLGRLAADGVEIRAIFGSLWWLLPTAGLGLGAAAAAQTNGEAVPPSLSLLIAVLVIASFDALTGFVATFAFAVLVSGDVFGNAHGAMVVLGVGFLWCSLPLIATAIRPFRRAGRPSLRYRWDRIADLAITSLLCGVVAQKLTQSMDAFAGAPTGLPDHAGLVGLIAAAAIAVRVLVAHAADLWWQERLIQTEVEDDFPEPTLLAVVGGIVVRVAVFGFVGHVFIGQCWQWWAAVILFALPDLIVVARDRLGIGWRVPIPLPTGITEVLVLVISATLIVALAVAAADSELGALRLAFVAAALAPTALAVAHAFRDDEQPPGPTSWDLQLAGIGVLVTTVILAAHGWNY